MFLTPAATMWATRISVRRLEHLTSRRYGPGSSARPRYLRWARSFDETNTTTIRATIPFADLGPINSETISQDRKLTNAGVRSDISYVKGIHNVKAGDYL